MLVHLSSVFDVCLAPLRMRISNANMPPPPRGFGLGQLTRHNVGQLRELHMATIPVVYEDKVYNQILEHPEYSRLGRFRR